MCKLFEQLLDFIQYIGLKPGLHIFCNISRLARFEPKKFKHRLIDKEKKMIERFLFKCVVYVSVFFFFIPQVIYSNSSGKDLFYIKTFGTSDIDSFSSYDTTKDGGLIIGTFTKAYSSGDNDTCLTKLNKNGDIEWSKIFIKPSDEDAWIKVKESKIGGYISIETSYSSELSSSSLIIRRYTISGEVTSSKKYSIENSGNDIFLEFRDGALIILNKVENNINIYKLNPIGNIQWQRTCTLSSAKHSFHPKQIIYTNDGGFAIIGHITYYDNKRIREGLFLKFDYSGHLRVKKRIVHKDSNQSLLLRSILQNKNNEYLIICGAYPYNCLIKLDQNGNIYSNKILSKNPVGLYSIARTDKDDSYIIYGIYSNNLVLMEIRDNEVVWKTLHEKLGFYDGSYIQKRKQFPGYLTVYTTNSDDIGIIQINSKGFVSDKCGTSFTYNFNELNLSPLQQSNFELSFKKVNSQIHIEKSKAQIVDISNNLFSETICSSYSSDDDNNTNSMFLGVTWFLNGRHTQVIPDGFEGKIVQLHSWWGNHGVQLDLNNSNSYEFKNYDTGYRDCNDNPDTCVEYAYRDFTFTNGFSLKDFYLWFRYWHDPTHGKVKCFRHDCLYKPYGAGATFKINSRDFQCLDNEWYYQTYPMLTESGETIYCKQFNVCGDGVIANKEECDDFNQDNGDGCDCKCRKE